MKLISQIVPLAVVFGIGFWIGGRSSPPPSPPPANSSSALASKFQALTDNEIAEYYELKTMEERYKKADEILAKIMNIFVAELGLRVSSKIQDGSKTKIEAPVAEACALPAHKEQPVLKTPRAKNDQSKDEPKARTPVTEKDLEQVRGPVRIKEFLEAQKIDNLSAALVGTNVFSNRSGQLDAIQGRFRGMANVMSDQKRHYWRVTLSLRADVREGLLDGSNEVTMTENGKVFSNQAGRGTIRHWREGEGLELFLQVSPSTYFQLYYLKWSDRLIGNVYRANDAANFDYIGTVNLQRD